MPLKTYEVSSYPSIVAKPLTPESFAKYGGVISADHQIKAVKSSAANYGTAVKMHKVAPIVNNFAKSPSGKPATANWNIFRCSAPKHLIKSSVSSSTDKTYTSKVLERHPFSTQTFIPMGQNLNKISFLVIVAKTDYSTSPDDLPDPSQVEAFICKGNQSITYGAGTWHAPMVVVDENIPYIDFAVFIHENGVDDEDCQECYFNPGYTIEYKVDGASKL
ncbi:ureidoglycolate lyase [[Candida] railenensis]|uniref:Ureidoglycolate lyase n=1 Tax=[Candida] railenensis TaxID=45579 RepID=A0A9P0QQU3_9ASCO|nr:ureidoglycolate lyase [[Candida] railenensis]